VAVTLTASGIGSIEYGGSALRYGLVDIRPVEVFETIKRFGLKFRKITRTFERLQPMKSYADMVTFENEAILGTINIPKRFDAAKLIKIFSENSIENYEKDTEWKKAVEDVRRSDRKGRPLLSLIQFAKNRFESRRDDYVEIEAERFLRSNFPLSFYNKLVVFDNTYYDFLQTIENKVRRHEFLASCARNFEMYKKRIAQMQAFLSPIIDEMDECFFSYARLKKYVTIWNAREYEELLDPKFLGIKNVNFTEFQEIFNKYDDKLIETKRNLLQYNPELLHQEIDSKEQTTRMFSKIVMLPSSSLTLKADSY
jgi:hypothetical protein